MHTMYLIYFFLFFFLIIKTVKCKKTGSHGNPELR
jgi:hypothetical protein